MKPKLVVSAVALGMLAMSGAAFAATATATTDLNVRAGPGPQYEVVGVVGAGQAAEITGCLDGSKWCQIASNGGNGWVYSDYLTSDFGGKQVVLTERPANSVTILPPDGGTEGAAIGGATGAVAGALIGGPIGAAVGGVAGLAVGGAAGNAAEPPAQVRTYVTEKPGRSSLPGRRSGGRRWHPRQCRDPRDTGLRIPLCLCERPTGTGRPRHPPHRLRDALRHQHQHKEKPGVSPGFFISGRPGYLQLAIDCRAAEMPFSENT